MYVQLSIVCTFQYLNVCAFSGELRLRWMLLRTPVLPDLVDKNSRASHSVQSCKCRSLLLRSRFISFKDSFLSRTPSPMVPRGTWVAPRLFTFFVERGVQLMYVFQIHFLIYCIENSTIEQLSLNLKPNLVQMLGPCSFNLRAWIPTCRIVGKYKFWTRTCTIKIFQWRTHDLSKVKGLFMSKC